MKRAALVLLILLLPLTVLAAADRDLAMAERRVALVIGNGAYEDRNIRLDNPVNDANDMAEALKGCGFEVIKRVNASRSDMRRATYEFVRKIKGGGVGLFFYAGHGLQIDGINYLVPVDADINARFDIDDQCLKAGYILRAMEESANRLNIVILDACRNNPFRQFRDVGRGLALMKAPRGSVLAFSTSPDNVADDGPGRNGLYTSALLKYLPTPGLELGDLFIRVRNEVVAESGGRQTPWEHGSLMGHFYFVPTSGASITGPSAGSDDEENQKLEAERRRLAEEKAKLEEEKKRLEEEKLAEERRRLEEEKAKIEAEKKRLEEERRRAEERAREEERRRKEAAAREFTNSIGQKFKLIPAGTFMMGSKLSAEEVHRRFPGGKVDWYTDEHPRHSVTISRGYYLQTTEVTVGQWRKFIKATGYRTDAEKGGDCWCLQDGKWGDVKGRTWSSIGFSQSENHPVACVSWKDAQAFIAWLNKKEGSNKYRLPSEAEWEYAARGGSAGIFPWGDSPNQACLYGNVADQTKHGSLSWGNNKFECNDGSWFTTPVGRYRPNGFGLYDMIGNVWEWCEDWHGSYPSGSVTDPTGPSSGSGRVGRGGGWCSGAGGCRSASRGRNDPGSRDLGFRLARTF